MTQATKKTAALKTEVNDAIAQARAAGENTVQAFAASGKAAFDGVIAYDKAVLGYTRVAFDDTVAHVRNTLALKNVNELFEAQQAFAKSRYETVAAQGKELVELTRAQVEATVAPLRDAVPAFNKAA
jgi:phasin family protein